MEGGGTGGDDGVPPAAPDACAGPEGAAGGGGAGTTKQVGAAGGASSLRVWREGGWALRRQGSHPASCLPWHTNPSVLFPLPRSTRLRFREGPT